jgi:predicted dehydrogenase
VIVVGIVETNQTAIAKYQKRYNLPDSLFFDSYESLYQKAKPQAVSAFNQTNKHLEVVEFFAPLKIPIIVEKPLASNYEEAKKIEALHLKYQTPVLTNYETSWYESTYETKKMVDNGLLGSLTKMVFNTGHPGPQEIGCSTEFLEWLTDPIQNGGGALTDFGCYGANIATWFLEGQAPLRISCIAKQTKPDRYPDVDDDTTIILEYPKQQVLIQASWNWSHNRKDMQVYGSNGYIDAKTSREMIVLESEKKGSYTHKPLSIASNQKDPFRLLLEVTKYNKKLPPFSLYSLENNLIVSKILSLAKKAAETNQTLNWNAL